VRIGANVETVSVPACIYRRGSAAPTIQSYRRAVDTWVEGIMLRIAPLWALTGWLVLVAVNIGLAIAVSLSGAL
jgi:uncharacterized membrane protein